VARQSPSGKPSGGGFFARLRQRLGGGLGLSLDRFAGRQLDEALEEELETQLLVADAGIDATRKILDSLRGRLRKSGADHADRVGRALREAVVDVLRPRAKPLVVDERHRPYVILMVGVNGSGKTTTIGKLAHKFRDDGRSVMLAAGDTYRAAAIEQLQAWGERNGVPVISQQPGADPAAVIYDALEAATARGTDVLLADTAGRLQNQAGLMQELEKIVRVIGRLDATAPHETMLVLDASLGQNALQQAIRFNEVIGLSGITMTKLDSGAKGGILLALAERLDVPFRYIGIGEQPEDMQVFDAEQYADALLKPGA